MNTEIEIKMLEAARDLADIRDVRVLTIYLDSHALPPEANGDEETYIDDVCNTQLQAIAKLGLADCVDAFCEGIRFLIDQVRWVFKAAKVHDLPIKLHAEQINNFGGAALTAEFGGLLANHLEHVDEAGIEPMEAAGTAAVLLSGAYYSLRDINQPPFDLFQKHDVSMAITNDCKPGSSPLTSILLAMNMACTLFQMAPVEALAGIARNAAKALGRDGFIGTIDDGIVCDLAIWDTNNRVELSYAIGFNPLYQRIAGGEMK